MITVEFITKTKTLVSSIYSRASIKFKTKRGVVYTGKDIYHIRYNLVEGTLLLDKAIYAVYVTASAEAALLKAVKTSNRLLPPIPGLPRFKYRSS